jgi:hypothetical protein
MPQKIPRHLPQHVSQLTHHVYSMLQRIYQFTAATRIRYRCAGRGASQHRSRYLPWFACSLSWMYMNVPRLLARCAHSCVGSALVVAVACLIGLGASTAPSAAASPGTAAAAPKGVHLIQKMTLNETSIDGPALSGSGSVLAWTGTDALHHLNLMTSTGGLTYTNKLILSETSPFRPAVAEASIDDRGPFVVVAWTGDDPAHTLNVLWNAYGAAGSPRKKLTLRGDTSIGAPGLAAFPRIQQSSLLDLAWTGTDANHSLNVLPLTAETLAPGNKVILSQFSSDTGPNLAIGAFAFTDVFQWVLTWTSRAQSLNIATAAQGRPFTARPAASIQAESSAAAPSAIISEVTSPDIKRPSWLAWTGTNSAHNLNLRTTETFPTWPNPATTKTVLGDTALGGPQIARLSDSTGLIAWAGTDRRHHLNVAEFTNS